MTLRSLLLLLALFALPLPLRADVSFSVNQDVSSLYSAGSPPSPFYLGFYLNSGDNGLYNNTVSIFNFVGTGVSLVGSPIVDKGNSTGKIDGSYINPMVLQEGTSSVSGDYTFVYQKISIDAASAQLSFAVTSTQNYTGSPSPDMFTYQFLYDDDNNINTVPVPINTTLAPGSIDFVQFSMIPTATYQDVQSGGPLAGSNPFASLDNVGAAYVIPEPTTIVIWGLMLGGVGLYRVRRKGVELRD